MSWLNERLRQMQQAAAQQEAERQVPQVPSGEFLQSMPIEEKLLKEIGLYRPARLLEDIKTEVWKGGKVYKILEVVDHTKNPPRGMYGNTTNWVAYALIYQYPGLTLDWKVVGQRSVDYDGTEAIRQPALRQATLFDGVGIRYSPYGCDLEVVSVEGGQGDIAAYFYHGSTSGSALEGTGTKTFIGRSQHFPTPESFIRHGDVNQLTALLQNSLADDCHMRLSSGRIPATVADVDRVIKLAEYGNGKPR